MLSLYFFYRLKSDKANNQEVAAPLNVFYSLRLKITKITCTKKLISLTERIGPCEV